jgi:phosphatidylglycerol---prolipoprotein diacylglyceryl transferase
LLAAKWRFEMRVAPITATVNTGFPRFFRIAGYPVNSYKFFLCVGIYVGTLACAALASASGLSALRVGLATTACALVGMIGARLYYLLVHAPYYLRQRSVPGLWDSTEGGWSVFGTLITFVPASLGAAAWLAIPAPVLWDHMAIGVLVGGFWVRLGCVFNGCCVGAETKAKLGVCLHDTCGVSKPRIPVQFMEMAWWLMGLIAFFMLWPSMLPPGSYALAVLAWYGVGRFFLEPLREQSDVVFGRVRIDQVVAALLALGAGGVLIFRGWAA